MKLQIFNDDCLAVLATLPENSVDAVVTDPPYHLTSIVKRFGGAAAKEARDYTGERAGATGAYARASRGFMGKEWDGGDVAFRPETWAAVLRVLKPGGHLVAFAACKSSHRMVCAIEDAGFEVRDALMWLFGSGFPKSLDVSKAMDKAAGDACEWQGWGTALKPAYEPICLARKPLSESSVAANVLRWRTGALNIDATRIAGEAPSVERRVVGFNRSYSNGEPGTALAGSVDGSLHRRDRALFDVTRGRWPANVAHDGSDEVVGEFPHTASGRPGVMRKGRNDGACLGAESRAPGTPMTGYGDEGSAARFFYSAKANASDRVGSKHPTVKPVSLMRWLVRLVTPPGGLVLDPFAGSGTTGEAALREGFRAMLVEREAEYYADIIWRLTELTDAPEQDLFA